MGAICPCQCAVRRVWGGVPAFVRTTGDGDATSPRPCPGFPLLRERRCGGVRGRRGLLVVGVRQAQGERIWEVRVRWGVGDGMGDARRATVAAASGFLPFPLRFPSGNGLTTPPPSPFGGSGRERIWGRVCGGEWGMRWGWRPRAAGLPGANRNDDGGVREGRGAGGDAGAGWWWRALRQAQGERIWEVSRAAGSGGCDGDETPRAAPLPWVPVFTGTTMGGWWSTRAGGG